MFCVTTAGPIVGDQMTWRGRRTVEVLAYDADRKEVRILVGIYAENIRADGKENSLAVMHPGRAVLELPKPCLGIQHPDEPPGDDAVLLKCYGDAFRMDNDGSLWQSRILTAWDEWTPQTNPERVFFWNPECSAALVGPEAIEERPISPEHEESKEDHVPFSVWKLTGFKKVGPYLIYLQIRLLSSSFAAYIDRPEFFTVDGPHRLFYRIRQEIARLPKIRGDKWLVALRPFESFIDPGEGYDIVILNPVNSTQNARLSPLDVKDCYQVALAPNQFQGHGRRFITRGNDFCLALGIKGRRRPSPTLSRASSIIPSESI